MIKRLADRLLQWFCREDLYLFIRGDLQENYDKHIKQNSSLKADWLFLMEVLLLFRPAIIQLHLIPVKYSNPISMFNNYLKITLRNLRRQHTYALVNIIGLSVGIVSLFYIWIFIENELAYDQHHEEVERIFRVSTEGTVNGEWITMATSPPGLAKRLAADLPEVQEATRVSGFLGIKKNILKVDNRTFMEEGGYFAEHNFFKVLTYQLLNGDPETALNEPQSIVLSHSLAKKLFNATDVLGQTISITNDYGQHDYNITGVFEDEGVLSHLNPTFICSMNSGAIGQFVMGSDQMVGNNFLFTYIRTNQELDPTTLQEKIADFLAKYVQDAKHTHSFLPVRDIYLHAEGRGDDSLGGDIRYLYILATIALLILIIACVNFANLATAQATKRAKEIGVRKTFGAYRQMIISQFLAEAMVMSLLATLVSVLIIALTAPGYTHLTGKPVTMEAIIVHAPVLVIITLITALLAGSYPAFYLSRLKLQSALRSGYRGSSGSFLIRKGLVVFQFIIGILFIIGSFTTLSQLQFIKSQPLGFQVENQLVIPLQSQEAIQDLEKVKQAFSSIPAVIKVAGTSYTPAEFVLSDNHYRTTPTQEGEGIIIRQNDVDFGLIETLGIELIAGRTFNPDFAQNDSSILLNETAVRSLGLTNDEVLNRDIYTSEGEGIIGYRVIGIVKDFHANSLHKAIEPYLFAMRPGRAASSLIVTTANTNPVEVIQSLERSWEQLFPQVPFEFSFLDEQLQSKYSRDEKFGQIIMIFTVIALVLCFMGIFALTSFSIQQNMKAISIKKVLGAQVGTLYIQMVSRFLLLVILASIIALPIGLFVMNKWLALFAYRIETDLASGLVPVMLIVISTLLVISRKLLKVAKVNPATILRSE
ncbi:MAG: ABC transporter permease [Cytophagales bacterium]|nr:ABC transporter permease [Cytophagales bacterium]